MPIANANANANAAMAVSTASRASVRVEPKSTHVADAALQPFIQSTFDPVAYLNSTLPALAIIAPKDGQADRVPLSELSTRAQSSLSHLNAQTSRLSNTLTQLTDDILRSGSRLAYDVEILRGETTGLSETLHVTLQDDIARFAPGQELIAPSEIQSESGGPNGGPSGEPEYIKKLRTLTLVRARLDSVIQTFGQAMGWPLPPSELSIAPFIAVSAPETAPDESRSREEKGRETAEKLRNEIVLLLESAATAEEGINAATSRLDELNELATVWKGTAEEKARSRFIESLFKLVDEEQRKHARRTETRRQGSSPARGLDYRYGSSADSTRVGGEGGYGFIKSLQRMKGDVYLE